MMRTVGVMIFLFMFWSCTNDVGVQNMPMESALSSVVKLISAQSFGNLNEAEKYIDVEKVYSKHFGDTVDVRSVWKQQTDFQTSLNNMSKFTGHFKYFNYEITEVINGGNASVRFISKSEDSTIKEIKYSLVVRDGRWVVVDIDYIQERI